jgi:hypothetical protein
VKKLLGLVVLGSLVVVGCDKPTSTTTPVKKTPVVAPMTPKEGDKKGEPDKKTMDEGKKATDDAAKKAAETKDKK